MAASLDECLAVFSECPICMETFDDPRMLPCGHSMCLTCVEGLEGDDQPILCPTCRTPYEGQISALAVNYQLRDLIASIREQLAKQNILAEDKTSAEESNTEEGEAIEAARYHRVVMNLAFTKAVETAMQDLISYVKMVGKPNATVLTANENLFQVVQDSAVAKKRIDSEIAEKWSEIEKMTEQTRREVSAIPILGATNRIEKLKLGSKTRELDNIKFRNVEMKSSTFFTSLLNLFATYIYYGIEGNEQGFCDEVISRMQKHSPKLIWTCCVGTFNATQRFHEAFMQLDNFFGKSFIVYDYHLGNCCEPPEETIAERLLEIAVLHEKDEDSVQNIRKALEDVFDGRYWNCAICNSDATFFYATSDLSKLQIFHAELSNGNFVKAWLLVK